MDNELANIQMELRKLNGQILDNGVNSILLDLQLAIRKAYPDTIDSEPYARRIVAYLREHLV